MRGSPGEAPTSVDPRVDVRTVAVDRPLAEETVRAAQEVLQEEDRRKDALLVSLARELRDPLAAITAAVELMGHIGMGDPLLERARAAAERQSRRMVRLLDGLLDISRVSAKKFALTAEDLEVAAIVDAAVGAASALLGARRQAVSVSLSAEDLCVRGDRSRLTQALSHLLDNASRYTPPGGRIDLCGRREGDEAVLTVRDEGVGIAPELLPFVFDPFFRGDPPPDGVGSGLGIGLAVARQVIELHGGRVTATSAGPGEGSEFTIRLPALAEPAAPASSPEVSEKTGDGTLRILLVEDNPDAAEMLGILLRARGHEVEIAGDGTTAFELALRLRPDVALVDIVLPGMNGHEVARRIRREPTLAGMTLVALTGYGHEEDVERSLAAGFDHHLVKPVGVDAVLRVLAGHAA